MGTGIVNTLLFDLPWRSTHAAFRAIGAAFLLFDIALFVAFATITILRYALYPRFFMVMVLDNTHSLFLGTIPMGLITIMSGITRTGLEYGLDWCLPIGLVGWWIALVLSVLTSFGVPFVMFTKHSHTPEALTAAWLLPVVPPITVAAVGSTMSSILLEQGRLRYSLTIMIASYIMNGVGLLIACGLMVIYFQRLALHHLPNREVIVSTFLPLGPCGQGGYALIELGRVAYRLIPALRQADAQNEAWQALAPVGMAMYGAGIVTGLLLWGLGIWWMFLAIVSVGTNFFRKTLSFNMSALAFALHNTRSHEGKYRSWWSFTFPLGSLCLLTYSIGETFDSIFFNVVGTTMTAMVVGLWMVVFVPTAIGFFKGTLFAAPCLASLSPEYVEKLPVKLSSMSRMANGQGETAPASVFRPAASSLATSATATEVAESS